MPMPSLFISHGGPNIVIDDSAARDYLKSLPNLLGRPEAIVVASAHFETSGAAVVSDPSPGMIYDFGGFPQELYEMVYPAPGNPELAGEVAGLLEAGGIRPKMIEERGYDHGTWTPLILAYPEADIPVVQVSIDPGRDAQYHHSLGLALASLRERNILVIGSGHITHNLRAVFSVMRGGGGPMPEMEQKVDAFTGWLRKNLEGGDRETLLAWKERAPFPRENHPTDEHLMPLFFALGAGGPNAKARLAHDSRQFGFFAFDSWMFE